MDLVYFLLWWLSLTGLGWIALALFQPIFKPLSGNGYLVTKIIGLLLVTHLSWIAASIPFIPYSSITIYIICLTLISLGAILVRHRGINLHHIPWKSLLFQEGLFVSLLAAWSIVRAFNPRIEGVEKFMNIAFINAGLRTDTFPTIDPWYAGETINYYYYGHLFITTLAKISHVPAQYAFNLGVATIFALTATIAAAFIYSLTKSKLASLTTAFLIVLAGNLDPALNMLKQTKDYIFFSATRLDPYTINEFPLYSFVIADLHAHTLGLPNTLTIISLLFIAHQSIRLSPALIFLLALSIGATAPTNAFDALIYGGLTGLVIIHRAISHRGWTTKAFTRGLLQTTAIGALSLALYAPFYLNFNNPTGGLGVDIFETPLSHLAINFGAMLILAIPFIIHLVPHFKKLQLNPARLTSIDGFVLLILICSLGFILFTEIFYLKDIYSYENPPYARANTIFKVYYQVWILLAIVAGYGLYLGQKYALKYRLTDIYIFTFAIVISFTAMGTWSAATSYAQGKSTTDPSWTLDGYAYLKNQSPDQLALIDWMNANIDGQQVIAEASGDSYTQQSRISSYTGLPTPIGWASHEWGWRYSPTTWAELISPRVTAMEQLYNTTDTQELISIINQYNITYIVYSPTEFERYATSDDTIQALAGQPIFSSGDYKLYQIPSSP